MALEDKRKKSIDAYYKLVDDATKKKMPWQDIDSVRQIVYQYSELCEETMNHGITEENIETMDALVRILKKEVKKYHGKREKRRVFGRSKEIDARV